MKLAERTFKRNDYKVTSKFGNRTHPVTGEVQSFHSGEDYGTQLQNWNVYAIEDGKVLASNSDATNGNYIWVSYPRLGKKAFYCHLHERFVSKGDTVNNDTVIGLVGNTGRSTAIHLHFGWKDLKTDKYEDPNKYNYIPLDIVVEVKPIEVVKPQVTELKVGDKIWIKQTATTYSTGVKIPSAYKKNGARHTKPFTIEYDGDKSIYSRNHKHWLVKEIKSYVKKSEVEKA